MERHQYLFAQLVAMFQFAAMQQMGKIKNPVTDTIERDLDAARTSIDMLEMLRERTKGNLGSEEERFLNQVLHELRLNFVDEAAKSEPPAAAPGQEAGEKAP
jgi:hypothetical protein